MIIKVYNALQKQLETVFKIAKHFKAVLLLDEADAFMEQRTSYHDTPNRLRKLEYYQGLTCALRSVPK